MSGSIRVTSGKSRVRESGLRETCERGAEWPGYSTRPFKAGIWQSVLDLADSDGPWAASITFSVPTMT
jgi:hypothetical protein